MPRCGLWGFFSIQNLPRFRILCNSARLLYCYYCVLFFWCVHCRFVIFTFHTCIHRFIPNSSSKNIKFTEKFKPSVYWGDVDYKVLKAKGRNTLYSPGKQTCYIFYDSREDFVLLRVENGFISGL